MNHHPCSIAVGIFKFHVINWYILKLLYENKGEFLEAECILKVSYTEIKGWCSLKLLTIT